VSSPLVTSEELLINQQFFFYHMEYQLLIIQIVILYYQHNAQSVRRFIVADDEIMQIFPDTIDSAPRVMLQLLYIL